jgi:hypothetical protein
MYGVDTLFRVTNSNDVKEATNVLETKPIFWGRYFSGTSFRGDGEYFRKLENNPLHLEGVRILPIARDTERVMLGQVEGKIDGTNQAQDVILSFDEDYLSSQGGEYYLFLDVELSQGRDTSLSSEYFLGWSNAVLSFSSKVKFLPCVYLSAKDSKTSRALNLAIRNGAECHGLWIANYGNRFRKPSSPQLAFDPDDASPATNVPNVPVLLWQYAGEIAGDFDLNVSNPLIKDNDLINNLILPPSN